MRREASARCASRDSLRDTERFEIERGMRERVRRHDRRSKAIASMAAARRLETQRRDQ